MMVVTLLSLRSALVSITWMWHRAVCLRFCAETHELIMTLVSSEAFQSETTDHMLPSLMSNL